MNLPSNNAFVDFAALRHWNAQDIADAVPLRLFELFAFDATDARPSANREPAPSQRSSYVPTVASGALFRVHG